MELMKITGIPGIQIGNAQNLEAATGCTVILCEQGAVAGVDVRGGAPGTRETDLLKPENYVDKVHAVMLAGGSAFGLDAAAGVMQYLEENGVGFDVGVAKVPIVPGAVLFDLMCGDSRVRPDKAMGYQACIAARNGEFCEGSAGAGTGATVGKFFGARHAMKGGLGAACLKTGDLMTGAVVAVNCLGDVIDPGRGVVLAGAYREDPFTFMYTEEGMIRQYDKAANVFAGNTTIGTIITNAALTKAQANKVASMAHNGYGRTMRPAHTMFDGDTIFALSTGQVAADVNVVGLLAARVMEQAVINAVTKAVSLAGFKSYGDIRMEK
ncbi:P1 family peptidase|uniref:L-aminopeptidase/D-esterase n=1 Tax=Dendrosporobacter quercicolus TaxID=146817 RepID=A0A1G9UVC9_9FIRM|nr:P1 family peptidase [Dendrosporobacter quercicolus]NSL48014.1 P1 family peptidase [Dendrosporobacter quercicolus DSM 1736]SDM63873.1 L-aminopeptidase/D-esterase [Dendrosporobacter quercicolus]